MFWRRKKKNREPEIDLYRKLTREEINGCPIISWTGPIHIVRTQEDMLAAIKALRKERLLGFDTETRPAFQKGVKYPPALLQLAGEKDVYLFKLLILKDLDKLFKLLSNGRIKKVGVSVRDDIKDLREVSDFEPRGFIDIGDCARNSKMEHHGLRGLSSLLLGHRITKGGSRTNWAKPRLPKSAIIYAATDAWIGRKLYLLMKDLGCIKLKKPRDSAG